MPIDKPPNKTWTSIPSASMSRIRASRLNAPSSAAGRIAVWGRTHVTVGCFDDVDATLDLAACERLGVVVVRRPIFGGGTAFYQEGCAVMNSFLLDKAKHPNLDEELARFQPIFKSALDR